MCPLLRLLTEIRAAGLPVDISKCVLVAEAFGGGFGIGSQSLRAVLQTLFVSSTAEGRALDFHYGRFLDEIEGTASGSVDPTSSRLGADREKLRQEVEALKREIGEAFTLLRTKDEMEVSADRHQIVSQIMRTLPAADEAELLEAGQIALSPRDYMPLSRRQMRQNWRYLRLPVREGPAVDFDARATFAKISREGVYLDPVLLPRRVNRCELVLLIDVHGSMAPFHDLARRLMQTALDGGRFRTVRAFYFHNIPDDALMTSPAFTDAESLQTFMRGKLGRQIVFVIVSDAGAARGIRNGARVDATSRFLRHLSRTKLRVVWLNPVPRDRWPGTSAEALERFVPMFEINRLGMDRAIAALKKPPTRRDARSG
jgi:uncharacterized protein